MIVIVQRTFGTHSMVRSLCRTWGKTFVNGTKCPFLASDCFWFHQPWSTLAQLHAATEGGGDEDEHLAHGDRVEFQVDTHDTVGFEAKRHQADEDQLKKHGDACKGLGNEFNDTLTGVEDKLKHGSSVCTALEYDFFDASKTQGDACNDLAN